MTILTQHPFNVAANDTTLLKVKGSFVRVLESSVAFGLSFDGGQPITIERGVAVHLVQPFTELRIIAPRDLGVTGILVVSDGVISDDRVTISTGSALSTTIIKRPGPPLFFFSGELAADATVQVQALDTNTEWMLVQNRGIAQLGVSNASGAATAALLLDAGERVELPTGGPLHLKNLSATYGGRYAVAYTRRI